MGHMDPSDNPDKGAAEKAGADSLSLDKGPGRTPGSLMSVKIRKRMSVSSPPSEPPQAPRAEARTPKQAGMPQAGMPTDENAGKAKPASDAISRVTRRAQSSQSKRAPSPRPPAVRPPADQAPASGARPAQSRAQDIVAYWTRLKAARRFPRSSEIDAATVAESWPNSILIRSRPGSRALEPEKVFLSGEAVSPGLAGLRGRGRVNLSPMMLQWLLALAGAVVRESRPMNDVETFPSVKGTVHYRAVALPFSDNEQTVDHVLCHFQPDS